MSSSISLAASADEFSPLVFESGKDAYFLDPIGSMGVSQN